ncbi:MAG: metallophosphoesterase [Lysobacterales bacterium]
MPRFIRLKLLLITLLTLGGCSGNPPAGTGQAVFQHEFTGTAVPWTQNGFDDQDGKFTFAVFSDLAGGERDGVFDVAIEQLRLLRPELIVSVGDLIDGGDVTREQLVEQWDVFDRRAGHARAPVFYVGGNHDLTSTEQGDVWEVRYGKRYYHFIYKNVLFLLLDTEDNPPDFQRHLNAIRLYALAVFESGGEEAFAATEYGQLEERKSGRIGTGQAKYFRRVVAQHPEVRWTFVLMHKPAWERPGEENFSRIEKVLEGRPYTVFYGHVHSYLHTVRHGRDYVRLGTTGGSHAPDDPMAIDQVSLVTVSAEGVDIANLRLSGIFDKTGKVPLNGDELCLENCAKK